MKYSKLKFSLQQQIWLLTVKVILESISLKN